MTSNGDLLWVLIWKILWNDTINVSQWQGPLRFFDHLLIILCLFNWLISSLLPHFDLLPKLVDFILFNLYFHVILTCDNGQLLYPHAHLLDVFKFFKGLLVDYWLMLFSQVSMEIRVTIGLQLFWSWNILLIILVHLFIYLTNEKRQAVVLLLDF